MNFSNAYKNLNNLCLKKSEKAILLKLNYKNAQIKIIYGQDPQNLIIGIETNRSAWFLEKKEKEEVSTFIPKDIFERNKSIVYDRFTNSVQPFFFFFF